MKASVVVVVAGVACAIPALAQISFDELLIPSVPSSLPVLSLGPKQILPSSIVEDIVKSTDAKVELTCDEVGCYYHENGTLVAFVNNSTGETSIFPKLESLSPAQQIPLGGMEQYLNDQRIFPPDDTKIKAQRGATLAGNKNDGGSVTMPSNYLTDVWINRTTTQPEGEFQICGPGTKAFFSFGADGRVAALSHRWRPATKQGSFKGSSRTVSRDSVYDSILHQLTAANITNATVANIDICYYDSGESFIQPVFRWTASVPVQAKVGPEPIMGYIAAVQQPPELVPNITVAANTTLTSTLKNSNSTDQTRRASKRQEAIKVGLYPMGNTANSPIYDNDVHAFYNALATSTLGSFIKSQDYWDEPVVYENLKEDYVDSVNIALTRGHGSEHEFYTDGSQANLGGVTIDDIPASGFGPGAQGSLAYWIISTCDTVSTSADYSAENFHLAYDPWWHIFNGIHAVVGFRSEKWTDDGVTLPFAQQLAIGGGFVWSWLNTVNQSPYYNPNSVYGTNPQTGQEIWYGRPSAVVFCGHTDDTVLQMDNLGSATCLQQWWYY